MATTFEFAVVFDQRHISDNTPAPTGDGFDNLAPDDILTITGKNGAGIDTSQGPAVGPASTPKMGTLWGGVGFAEGKSFINTPPSVAPRGVSMGNLVVKPGDTAPVRGHRVTSVTKLVGKIGAELTADIILYFQCYTGEF